jgi:hypothetical protein
MFTFAASIGGGDLVVRAGSLVRVDGMQALRRWLEAKLLSVKGDWFELDTDGIGYFSTDQAEILVAQIRATVLSTPDVLEITAFDYRVSSGRLIVDRLRIRAKSGVEGGINGLSIAVG